MAVLKTFQSGSISIAKGTMTSSSITITSVDTSKSILFWNYSVRNTNRPNDALIFGIVSNNTSLLFERNSAGVAGGIQWYLTEFDSGVFVEHGVTSVLSGSTANITLNNTFNIEKSFPIVTYTTSGTGIEQSDWIGAVLSTANNLQLTCGGFSASIIGYQIVQFDGGYAQIGTANFANTGSYNAITINLGVTNAAVISSSIYNNTLLRMSGQCFTGFWSDTGTLVFSRQSGNGVANIYWNALSMGDGSIVQTGTASVADNTGSVSVTINPVDTNRSVAYLNGPRMCVSRMGGASTVQTPGDNFFRAQLTSPTNLLLARNLSDEPVELGWTVIEFNNKPPELDWTDSVL